MTSSELGKTYWGNFFDKLKFWFLTNCVIIALVACWIFVEVKLGNDVTVGTKYSERR